MSEDKVRENRLRRKLDRMGYRLAKSRRRDPDAVDYGCYAITNPSNHVVWGAGNGWFSLNLDEVEEWIAETTAREDA